MHTKSALFVLLAYALGEAGVSAESPAPRESAPSSVAQGWSEADKDAFWFLSQGSWLLPYDWFLHLEQAGSTTPFRDAAHLERLRFLAAGKSRSNPDGLPIGVVKDGKRSGRYAMLGLSCAACHTGRLQFEGRGVQVEGGPALLDFQGFLDALVASLEATLRDEAKFARFAAAVSAPGVSAAELRRDLEQRTKDLAARKKRNAPPHPPGYGRIDALGNILNEVLAEDLGVPENQQPPDAPVSYPVIWDAHQHDFVQWNGVAPNVGPGPLLRNIGEVLGVFGHLKLTPRRARPPVYQDTSVEVASLMRLEDLVAKLQSPQWPAAFPPIDRAKAAAGQRLYSVQCQSCHAVIRRDDKDRRVTAIMVEVAHAGTDATAAQNYLARTAKTGPLAGTQVFLNPLETFGETASAASVLLNLVFGVQLGQFEDSKPQRASPRPSAAPLLQLLEQDWEALNRFLEDQKKVLETLVAGGPKQMKVAMYKARPLNGVWASAPYLHNGSVPTLSDLLQRAAERPARFHVGSRQFDPVAVGLKSVAEEGGVRLFEFDTGVRGNSNAGHAYGTQLTVEEKRQLVEYLKTL